MASRMKKHEEYPDEDILEALRFLDTNGDGYISAATLKHVMTNVGEILTGEQVDQVMKEIGVDKNGKIAYKGNFITYTR